MGSEDTEEPSHVCTQLRAHGPPGRGEVQVSASSPHPSFDKIPLGKVLSTEEIGTLLWHVSQRSCLSFLGLASEVRRVLCGVLASDEAGKL